jgi:hypothetical protein
MKKIKIKDKIAMRIRKRLRKWDAAQKTKTLIVASTLALLAGCASYTPSIALPPRLILQPAARNCPDLEPLPFVKHSLAELEADAAVDAILRAMEIDLDAYPEPDEIQARRVEHILMWWK